LVSINEGNYKGVAPPVEAWPTLYVPLVKQSQYL
jgi:hypothetical protein